MQSNTTRYTIDKQARRQQLFVCLFLLPLVLLTLSGFTFIPNTAQTPNQVTETSLPLTLQMSRILPLRVVDDSCTEAVYVVQFSLSEIKLYVNVCALQHLSALASSAGAGGAVIGFISIWCDECVPVAAGATAIVALITASIDYMQYAAKQCGGVFLDISWDGGVQFEPACSPQDNGS